MVSKQTMGVVKSQGSRSSGTGNSHMASWRPCHSQRRPGRERRRSSDLHTATPEPRTVQPKHIKIKPIQTHLMRCNEPNCSGCGLVYCSSREGEGVGSAYLADVRRQAVDAGLREGCAIVPHQLVVHRQLRRKKSPIRNGTD